MSIARWFVPALLAFTTLTGCAGKEQDLGVWYIHAAFIFSETNNAEYAVGSHNIVADLNGGEYDTGDSLGLNLERECLGRDTILIDYWIEDQENWGGFTEIDLRGGYWHFTAVEVHNEYSLSDWPHGFMSDQEVAILFHENGFKWSEGPDGDSAVLVINCLELAELAEDE